MTKKSKSMRAFCAMLGVASVTVFAASSLVGCNSVGGSPGSPPSPVSQATTLDGKLKAIDADPNMTPQAKQMAKDMVTAHFGTGTNHPPTQASN